MLVYIKYPIFMKVSQKMCSYDFFRQMKLKFFYKKRGPAGGRAVSEHCKSNFLHNKTCPGHLKIFWSWHLGLKIIVIAKLLLTVSRHF